MADMYLNGKAAGGADGFGVFVRAIEPYSDIPHGRWLKPGGIGMAREVDQVQKSARVLMHERHFDQRMSVCQQLAPGLKSIENVAKELRVSGQAQPVIKAAEVPGNPGNGAFAERRGHDGGDIGVLLIDVDEFGRPDHGSRDESERRRGLRTHFGKAAIKQEQIGVFERRKGGVIPNAHVAFHIAVGSDRLEFLEARRRGTRDDDMAAVFGVVSQFGRRPIGGDDDVIRAAFEDFSVIRDRERDVIFG
jgi:hypothetical protein